MSPVEGNAVFSFVFLLFFMGKCGFVIEAFSKRSTTNCEIIQSLRKKNKSRRRTHFGRPTAVPQNDKTLHLYAFTFLDKAHLQQ